MAVRSHLNVTLLDDNGEPRASTAVAIAKKTGAAFTQLLYAAESGGAALPGPYLTDSEGRLDLFTPLPERVQITPSVGTARIEEFFSDPTDVVIQNSTVPVVIDGYSSNSDWALTVQNDASQSKAFRVLNDGGDAVLRVQQDLTGVNDLVSINLLDSSLPTTSFLHVARAITTTGFSVGRFVADVTAAAISGTAVTGEISASVASAGNATAMAGTATRSTGAASALTRGFVATISSQVAGTGTSNVGLHATSALHSGGSSVRNDAGLLVDGAAGWTLPILVVDTDAATVLFKVDQVGGILAASTQPRATATYDLGSTGATWATGYINTLIMGTNPAAAGTIRMLKNAGISVRNETNGGDINLIKATATNNVQVGATSGNDGTYVAGTNSVNLQVGANVEFTANATGSTVGRAAGAVGFYGSAGVTKPSAYTQTYTTASKTHAVPGVTTLVAASGTADGTVADVGTTFSQTGLNNNFRDVAAAIQALIVDVANTKQVLNAVVDDMQALNLVG
jgi:hypothetical protein